MLGVLVVLGLMPADAGATADPGWYAAHSSEERQAIVDYVYERSGHATVPHGGSAAATAEAISQSVIDSSEEEAPLAPTFGLKELVVTTNVGLLARLSAMAPTILAGAGTFAVGFAIGTGARKLFIRLTGPSESSENGAAEWSWLKLTWYRAGEAIFFGATVQQPEGAYLYNSLTGSGVIRWFEAPCRFSGFAPAAGARMQTHVASGAQCNEYSPIDREFHLYPIYVDYPYLLESDLQPDGAFVPFDAETHVPDYTISRPPDPGAEAVEAELDVLDADGNELLRDELDWALTPGSQVEEEPMRVGLPTSEEDQACKAYFTDAPDSDPGARSPEAEEEAADWDYDVESYEGVYNPLTRSTQTVKLRWGTKAWGYRHIVIRHGWDAGAAARTRLALADPTPRLAERDPNRESFIYVYNVAGLPEGMQCRQRVVVSYGRGGRVSPGRHIITSYIEAY